MSITKRSDKGSALTYQEMDDNFDAIAPRTSASGSVKIPAGDTSERDATAENGMFRYNESLNAFEGYQNGAWQGIGGVGSGDVNQNAFSIISVAGQNNVAADLATDTLSIIAGTNVSITTDASGDSITINSSGGGGSSFDGAYSSLTDVPTTFTPDAHNQAWSTITSTPTTLSGYGITDGATGTQGTTGLQGVEGPEGMQGDNGNQGTNGIGVGGSQGVQGIQGEVTGVVGPQGTQGTVGDEGNQGTIGNTGFGSDGAQGIQGGTGTQGTVGDEGGPGDFGPQGVQGPAGSVQGLQGVQGLDGEAGPEGFGAQGFQGTQGVQGDLGIQGTDGPAGFGLQGRQGVQGDLGPIGPEGEGAQGMQGFTGIQGDLGPEGPEGAGAQGIQGIEGFQGAQGVQGRDGVGATGAQGIQGTIGMQGDAGATGQQGTQGAGNQGIQGIQGLTGFGIQGTQGTSVQGDTGQDGLGSQGIQGESTQGLQGFLGNAGSQGVQGFQGIQGVQGSQGMQGYYGPQGITGTGQDGIQGAGGIQGDLGNQGTSGVTGNGVQGLQGNDGPNGNNGAQGSTGSGSQGTQGVNGVGSAGMQGAAGFNGSQGAQGTQGTQGLQSIQGLQGLDGLDTTSSVNFADNIKATFGTGNDLEIFHDGSNSYIKDVGIGSLFIDAPNNMRVTGGQGSTVLTIQRPEFQAAMMFETFNSTSNTSNYSLITASDGNLHIGADQFNLHTDSEISFDVDSTPRVMINADGLHFNGYSPTVDNDFNNSGTANSSDAVDYQQLGEGIATGVDISAASVITPNWAAPSGSVYNDNKFRILAARGNSADALLAAVSSPNGGYGDTTIIGNVDVNGVNTKLITGLGISGEALNLVGTVKVTGTLELADHASHADGVKAKFGAGDDLSIYHNGTDTFLKNNTGQLGILGDAVRIRNSSNSEQLISADANGAVNLYYDNAQKLATTAAGVDVTGTVTAIGAVLVNGNGGTTLAIDDSRSNVGDLASIDLRHNGITASQIKSATIEDFSTAAKRTSNLSFHVRNSGSIIEAVTIDPTGEVILSGGIYIGGNTPNNKLDDYEEGTWVPADGSGAGITGFTLTQNRYTKTGRHVFAHCQILIPTNTDTTMARLTLPFVTDDHSTNSATGGVCQEQNVDNSVVITAAVNYTNGLIFRPNGYGNYTWANLSGKTLRFTINYNTA